MTRHTRTLALLLAVGLLALLPAALLQAHGIGTPQQINVSSGPYLISIWTDPDPLRVDEAHVVVAVMEPETRRPLVENVLVSVSLVSAADPALTVTGQADYSISTNRLLHAVEFNDQLQPGLWNGTVVVDGPSGPGEPVPFAFDVEAGRSTNWLLLGGVAVGLLVAGWLVLSLRRKPEHVDERQATPTPS